MKPLILSIVLSVTAALAAPAQRAAIVPQPAEYSVQTGTFDMPKTLTVAAARGTDAQAAKTMTTYLQQAGLKVKAAGKGKLTVTLDPSMPDEAYTLQITPKGIAVTAAGNKGLMYAAESLSQLDRYDRGHLQACTINDRPRFGYRGLMLDVVRCYMEPQEIKRMIDIAAKLKLNNLHLHLTDDNGWRLEIKKYPRLNEVGAWRVDRPERFPGRLNARSADEPTTYGGFYTQDQMRDIVAYAAQRNINIIPEIEMPAHSAAAIASYSSLACPTVDKFVGVFPGIGGKDAHIILCAGKDSTYQFLTDVLDEVIDLFPSKYIHLGGDEANKRIWHDCPLCNQRIADQGLKDHEALQAYLMDRINHHVRSRGRVAMGWDEATYGDPKEDMVIYGWQGDGGVAVRDSRRSGRKFIMTPAKYLYLIRYQGPQWFEPWTYFGNSDLKTAYSYEATDATWTDSLRSNMLGIQGSLWTEFCRTPQDVEYQIFPRLIGIADAAWRPEGTADWQAFLPALDNFLPTLANNGITYARSMYNIDHKVRPLEPGKVQVELSCIRPDVELRYAFDDAPYAKTQPYTGPITVSDDATVYARTWRDSKPLGATLKLNLKRNLATGATVQTKTCRNGLQAVLTNGLRGSDRNSDFEWAGWHDGPVDFTVDLGSVQPVQTVSLGNLVHSDICIAAPAEIELWISDNGTDFRSVSKSITHDDLLWHKQALIRNVDFALPAGTQARYIRLTATNPGHIPDGMAREGTPTWLYFDELTVK